MQEKNELQLNQDGSILLIKNGQPCFCPKQAIAWGQNKVSGEPFPIKQSCSNSCPLFKIRSNDGKTFVDITCSGMPVPYLITNVQSVEKDSHLNII